MHKIKMLNLKMVHNSKNTIRAPKKVQKIKEQTFSKNNQVIKNQMMMTIIRQLKAIKTQKTKHLKHTKKYKQMFGDSYEIGKDYAQSRKGYYTGETHK